MTMIAINESARLRFGSASVIMTCIPCGIMVIFPLAKASLPTIYLCRAVTMVVTVRTRAVTAMFRIVVMAMMMIMMVLGMMVLAPTPVLVRILGIRGVRRVPARSLDSRLLLDGGHVNDTDIACGLFVRETDPEHFARELRLSTFYVTSPAITAITTLRSLFLPINHHGGSSAGGSRRRGCRRPLRLGVRPGDPGDIGDTINEAHSCLISGSEVEIIGAGEKSKDLSDLIALIMRRLVELSVSEQRVEDAKVGVA